MLKGSASECDDGFVSRHRLAVALVLGLLPVTVISAQTLETQTAGLRSGRLNFFPTLAIEYSYNDNVFYVNKLDEKNVIGSGITSIRPQFLFNLPFGSDEVRFSYSPQLRHYGSQQYADTVSQDSPRKQAFSHYFDVAGTFHFGPSVTLQFNEHLLRGTQELRNVDPGGEVVFGTVPFLLNNADMELRVNLGARSGFSVLPTYSSVAFEQAEQAAFYDYATHGLEGRYNHLLSNATTFYVSYGIDTTDQSRHTSVFGDVTIDTQRAGVGLTRVLNRSVQANAFVGYTSMKFTGGSDTNFSGMVFSAGTHWQLSDVSRLDVTLLQQPYQSFFVNNNYYLYRGISLRFTRQIGQSMLLFGGGGYEYNVYSDEIDPTGYESVLCNPPTAAGECPSAGVRRRDKALHIEAGLGFQIRPTMRWLIGYNRDDRNSNVQQTLLDDSGAFLQFIDPYDYVVNRIFVRFEVGWL
jgi:hypothetical protein